MGVYDQITFEGLRLRCKRDSELCRRVSAKPVEMKAAVADIPVDKGVVASKVS